MKTLITIALLFSIVTTSQSQWIQTSSTPEGGGVTDMVVLSDGTIIVTTASFNWPSGQPGGIRRSTNGGASWQNIVNVFNARSLWLGSTGKVFASYWPFPDTENLYESTNGGVSFEQIYWGSPNNNIFSIATKDNDNIIFIGKRNGVWKSINGGLWQPASAGMPPDTWVYDLDVDTSGSFIAAGTSKGLYVSSNNGNNWTAVSGSISQNDTITKVCFDYDITSLDGSGSSDRLLAGSKDGTLFNIEIYAGSNWTTSILHTFNYEVTGIVIFGIPTAFWSVNTFGGGFHMSINNGRNWEQMNEGFPPSPLVSALDYILEAGSVRIYSALFENSNGGAKVYTLNMPVGIQQIFSEIPQVYELIQNYPNPFNPSTKIKFSLPNYELVKLVVYNSLGKEVVTLVNEKLSAGTYEYTFDGSSFDSGIYFYKLNSSAGNQTRKMILIK